MIKTSQINQTDYFQNSQSRERKLSPQDTAQSKLNLTNQIHQQTRILIERKNELLASFDSENNNQINNLESFQRSVNNHKRMHQQQKKNLADNETNLFYNPVQNPINYIDKKGNQTLSLGQQMLDNRIEKNRSLSISERKDDLLLFYKYKSGFSKSGLESLERSPFDVQLQQLQIRQQQKKVIGDYYQKSNNVSHNCQQITYKKTNIQNNPKYIIKLNPSPPPSTKKKKILLKKNHQNSPNKKKIVTEKSNEVLPMQQEKIQTQFFYSRQHQMNQLDNSLDISQLNRTSSIRADAQNQLVKNRSLLKDSLSQHFRVQTEPNQFSTSEFENEILIKKDYYDPEPLSTIDEQNIHQSLLNNILPNINLQANKSSPMLQSKTEDMNSFNKINSLNKTVNIEAKDMTQIQSNRSQSLEKANNYANQLSNDQFLVLENKDSSISPQKKAVKLNHQSSNLSSNLNSVSPLKRGQSIYEKSAVQSKTSLVNLDMLEKDLIDIQKEYNSNSNSPLKRLNTLEQNQLKSTNSEQKLQNQGTQKWLKKPSQYTILNDECAYSPEKTIDFENKQLNSCRSLHEQSISPQISPNKQRPILSHRSSLEKVIQSKANQTYLEDKLIQGLNKNRITLKKINSSQQDSIEQSTISSPNQSIQICQQNQNYQQADSKKKLINIFSDQSNIQYSNKPFKLQRSQKEFDLNLNQTQNQKNTVQQNVLIDGYGVSLVTQFQHLKNQKVDVKIKDEISEDEIMEEAEFSQNQSIIQKYEEKGLLKDRHYIKYHKEIINMLQAHEKDGITKKQSQELLNLIYRAKKYENFSQFMEGCQELQTDLNSLDQDLKEQTESLEQKKDNLAQILEVLNDIQDIDPTKQQEQLKTRLQDLKKIKIDTIQNTKEYILEMNQIKSSAKVYQLSGLDKRKFLKNNLDKLKKQKQKNTLQQFKKVCKTENLII
ncbi:hypothetical protein ABPG74_000984 [Tetrahymena malaccensis]